MRTCIVRAAVVMALVSTSAGAQSLSLTESQALAQLSPSSPRVRAIRAAVDLARADVLAAARWPNPRVTFNRESVAGITENIATVGQLLPITGRRGLEVGAASALVEAARAGPTMRCAVRGPICGWRSPSCCPRRRASASWPAPRAACASWPRSSAPGSGRRRRRLRPAARRARGARRRRRSRGGGGGSRASAGGPCGFFADAGQAASIVAVPSSAPRGELPSLDALIARAEATRGELLALRHEVDSARSLSARPDAGGFPSPRSSPAPSRRMRAAATSAA